MGFGSAAFFAADRSRVPPESRELYAVLSVKVVNG
jgi:hypothetical protein